MLTDAYIVSLCREALGWVVEDRGIEYHLSIRYGYVDVKKLLLLFEIAHVEFCSDNSSMSGSELISSFQDS